MEDKDRLEKCREFMEGLTGREVPAVVPELVELLHDRWSEVRSTCAKLLARIPGSFNKVLCETLAQSCVDSNPWQVIHGSVLGLEAMLSSADSAIDGSMLESVGEICLGLLGHVNIPVKDAARACIATIQSKTPAKSALSDKVVGMIETVIGHPNNDSDANALVLDGLLGCLSDMYQNHPDLIPIDEPCTNGSGVVGITRLCALHPASIVRQKAGQIFALFVLTPLARETSAAAPIVTRILALLTAALCTPHGEHWCLQEISLMVAEELVKAVVEHKLEILAKQSARAETTAMGPATQPASAAMLEVTDFMAFLKDHLHILLAHSQFEVRRMAVQLTPQLARAFVLMNASAVASGGIEAARPSEADLSMHLSAEDAESAVQRAVGGVLSEDMHCVGGSCSEGEEEQEQRPSQQSATSSDLVAVQQATTDLTDTISAPHDFGLRVDLNSSFLGQRARSGGKLDLPLVAQMVWLCECIKENQHLFEAFALSDQWKSSSVTKELQMRTLSVKDAAATQIYWQESGDESLCYRNAVDHWSLDVRGRLQEIEKRAHFHRTVKSLVATAVDTRSPCMVELLVRNAQALLLLTEGMISRWQEVLRSADKADAAVFTSTLSTYNSVLDGGVLGRAPAVISVDFVECYALIDSFLLSVQHRFVQCPDIRDCSCAATEEVGFLASSAEVQRQSLGALWGTWTTLLAQIQCVSRCSTHASSRSGISGHSTARPSACEILLLLQAGPHRDHGQARRDLFSDSLGDDASLPGVGSEGGTLGEAFRHLAAQAKVRLHQAEAKTPRAMTFPIDQLLTAIDAQTVLLTPSLTNAAVDIAGHAYGYGASAGAAQSDFAYLQTPAHGMSHSVSSTPQSSHTQVAPAKTVYTPSALHFSSPHAPSSHSLLHTASGGAALVHRYQAMDQWNCEAVSPMATCLAGGCRDGVRGLQLAAVVAEWIASCVMHPLWLDCRHNARKNLFEALVLLLSGAEEAAEAVGPEESVSCLLLLRVVRAVAEVLVLRAPKPLLDVKSAICLVKAGLVGARLFERHWRALQEHCAAPTARLGREDTDNTGAVEACRDLYRGEVRPLALECAQKLKEGTAYYQTVFPERSPHSHAELLRMQLAGQPRKEPSSPSRRSRSADSPSVEIGALPMQAADDEFSDWDEDSGTDEEPVHLTDQDAANVAHTLAHTLYCDSVELCDLVAEWGR